MRNVSTLILRKSMKMNEKQGKSSKIKENPWKPMEFDDISNILVALSDTLKYFRARKNSF